MRGLGFFSVATLCSKSRKDGRNADWPLGSSKKATHIYFIYILTPLSGTESLFYSFVSLGVHFFTDFLNNFLENILREKRDGQPLFLGRCIFSALLR